MKTCKNDKNKIKYLPILEQYCIISNIIEKKLTFAQKFLKMTNLPVLNFYEIVSNCRKYSMLEKLKIFLRNLNTHSSMQLRYPKTGHTLV